MSLQSGFRIVGVLLGFEYDINIANILILFSLALISLRGI